MPKSDEADRFAGTCGSGSWCGSGSNPGGSPEGSVVEGSSTGDQASVGSVTALWVRRRHGELQGTGRLR